MPTVNNLHVVLNKEKQSRVITAIDFHILVDFSMRVHLHILYMYMYNVVQPV